MNIPKLDKEKLQSKKIKSEGVNLFISYLLLIVTTIAIIIFLGCQFGCNKKDKVDSLPLNADFYDIDNEGVIQGFSTSFLEASDTEQNARQYMIDNAGWGVTINDTFDISMDLHGRKITEFEHAFSSRKSDGTNANIDNIFKNFVSLNFSNTQWMWETVDDGGDFIYHYSGWETFSEAHFSNVKYLNLESSNFATNYIGPSLNSNVYSGSSTFSDIWWMRLENLNLANSNFATSNMAPQGRFHSGAGTFANDTFYDLTTLNLHNAVFATVNMTSGSGWPRTMYDTFSYAIFGALQRLDLSTVVFTVKDMCGSGWDQSGGRHAFGGTIFAQLNTLNFGNIQLQQPYSNDGSNAVNELLFSPIINGSWNQDNPLQIFGSWDWGTAGETQLNNWFGVDSWIYNQQ